jgi:hypothetical protein
MNNSSSTDETIKSYISATVEATSLLFQKELYGHLLIVIYSTIDTLGLLDAPPEQISSGSDSFKNWVKKYLLSYPGTEFNEMDLWAARCAVLHTFTAQSDLSRKGSARELIYYGGDKHSDEIKIFASNVRKMNGGKFVPVCFEDLYLALLAAIRRFIYDLEAKCQVDKACSDRLRNILQTFPLKTVL